MGTCLGESTLTQGFHTTDSGLTFSKVHRMSAEPIDFEEAVNAHYQSLYRFALTLSHSESDACDLVQSAFERLLRKSEQLRDVTKVKTWLFTTLYRLFLEERRSADRFPQVEMEAAELPPVESTAPEQIDGASVLKALNEVEEPFRAPLVLFYLEDHSYREIAEILGVPIGTVMSRLARGKTLLRALLADSEPKILPLPMRAAS
jgi:RNA polymerase sigma-70 factor, ECF subfamily